MDDSQQSSGEAAEAASVNISIQEPFEMVNKEPELKEDPASPSASGPQVNSPPLENDKGETKDAASETRPAGNPDAKSGDPEKPKASAEPGIDEAMMVDGANPREQTKPDGVKSEKQDVEKSGEKEKPNATAELGIDEAMMVDGAKSGESDEQNGADLGQQEKPGDTYEPVVDESVIVAGGKDAYAEAFGSSESSSDSSSAEQEEGDSVTETDTVSEGAAGDAENSAAANSNNKRSKKASTRKSKQARRDKQAAKLAKVRVVSEEKKAEDEYHSSQETANEDAETNKAIDAIDTSFKTLGNENENKTEPDYEQERLGDLQDEQRVHVQFHAFVCPDIKANSRDFQFGIVSSYGSWSSRKMWSLEMICLRDGNYIVSGSVKLEPRRQIEYNYAFMYTGHDGESEFFVEPAQHRVLKLGIPTNGGTLNVYDGLILPPDEESKKGMFGRLKDKVAKTFGFKEELRTKYADQVDRAMLYQLDLLQSPEKGRIDLNIFSNMTKAVGFIRPLLMYFARAHPYEKWGPMIERIAGVCKENEISSLAFSCAIFFFHKFEFDTDPQAIDFRFLFRSLNVSSRHDLNEIFPMDEKCVSMLIDKLPQYYSDFRHLPESLFVLELTIKLILGQNTTLSQIILSNDAQLKKLVADITRYHIDISVNDHMSALKSIEKPSEVLVTLLLPSILRFEKAPLQGFEAVIRNCRIEHLLVSIENMINNAWTFKSRSFGQSSTSKLIDLMKNLMAEFLVQKDTSLLVPIMERCHKAFQNIKRIESLFHDGYIVKLLTLFIKLFLNCLVKQSADARKSVGQDHQEPGLVENQDRYRQMFIDLIETLANYLYDNIGQISLNQTVLDQMKYIFEMVSSFIEIHETWQLIAPMLSKPTEELVFVHCIQNLNELSPHKLVKVCLYLNQNREKFHADIERHAFEAIKHKIEDMNKNDINELTKLTANNQMSDLAQEILRAKWPKSEDPLSLFGFIFESFQFLSVFLLIDDQIKANGSEFVRHKFAKTIELIESTLASLADGTIRCNLLLYLNENMKPFLSLFEKIETKLRLKWLKTGKNAASSQAIISKLANGRRAEFECFKTVFQDLANFADFVKKRTANATVNLAELSASLSKYSENTDFKLNEIMEPLSYREIIETREGDQTNSASKIRMHQSIINELTFINQFIQLAEENLILSLFLKEKSEALQNRPVSVDAFMSSALKASWAEYLKFGQTVQGGSLVLSEFDRLSERIARSLGNKKLFEWQREFGVVLQMVQTDAKQIEQRIKQLEIYGKLGNIKKISALLLEIKNLNQLEGDFDALTAIYRSLQAEDFNRKRISEIDEKTMRIYSQLEDLSQKSFIKCLKRYIKNIDFIKWLKETAPTLEKLKFLAELASESENEGALEIIRCQSLTMVGTAYGPLIYDLSVKSNFDELLRMLKLVNANLKKNPKLAEKIDAIAKEKAWLEDVKNSKGNSEANSLKQAQKINERGVYTIHAENKTVYHDLTLNDIIFLKVPKDDRDPKDKEKTYKYAELVDLHDKLTLVVGKDDQQQNIIRYFEDIFEGIISVGEVFLNLLKTGNVLFKEWHATVYCQESLASTIKVNFGLSNQNQNIFGDRHREQSTLDSLNATIKFLQKCLSDWLEHVNEKRELFPELNHFRIDQIVILRSQLARVDKNEPVVENEVSKEESFENLVYPILYTINDKVTMPLLQLAHSYALGQGGASVSQEEEPEEEENEGRRLHLEQMLSDNGFSKKLIQNALRNVRSQDEKELMDYCYANEFNEDLLEMKKIEARNQKPLNFETVKTKYVIDSYDPYEAMDAAATLEVKYKAIWDNFKAYLDSNFETFVSINHLGYMLRYLKTNSTRVIRRKLPPYLDPSVPNLIICAQDQIISRTLSMYMLTPEQPLPSDDEILYCTAHTTADQIELFWKRVLHCDAESPEQKLFCLLNAQDLAYDQAVKAQLVFEKLYAAHMEDQGNHHHMNNMMETATTPKRAFNLCILCSSEKEERSVFVTAFNRYKKNVPLDNNADLMIRDYLSSHFTLNASLGSPSAAVLEKDNLNVRVITSDRSGCGKSLYVKRLKESPFFAADKMDYFCISIKKQTLPFESVFKKLKLCNKTRKPRVIHFDIAYETWYEVDPFLFNLLCMNYLVNASGEMWRRQAKDLYLIEIMPPRFQVKNPTATAAPAISFKSLHSVLNVLPTLNCLTPIETLQYMRGEQTRRDITMQFDDTLLNSETVQRSCQYLEAIDTLNDLDAFTFAPTRLLNSQTCIELLLKHSEIQNPSWCEIIHFASFLNILLKDSESSAFCNPALVGDLLPGFKTYVIRFMIQMSHDFALPSLEISDRSALQIKENDQVGFELNQLKMRRKWEVNPHPYLFFNPDGQTFTFFGFNVKRDTGQLVHPVTKEPIFEDDRFTMANALMRSIETNAPSLLREDISTMTKSNKLLKLLNVINKNHGFKSAYQVKDPDPSYELTMDNLLKMLAIHMRFRANIPVIIMGETGCGKTKLIEYYCKLLSINTPPRSSNLRVVKVHGGTTSDEILKHVKKAQRMARINTRESPGMYTVLFFDEANSTEAIGTIKEIMCDQRMDGTALEESSGLKIIAACNPYKKHSDEAIANFEKSGLGFYVDMNETQEKLGDIPMRHLVYRVQPLPASMLPMIWDFGHLNDDVERVYIRQIVNERFSPNNYAKSVHLEPHQMEVMENALHTSQRFLRSLENECSYVSLRDIQRVIAVFHWFLNNGKKIFERMDSTGSRTAYEMEADASTMMLTDEFAEAEEFEADEQDQEAEAEAAQGASAPDEAAVRAEKLKYFNRSLVLALNTCYHVGLQNAEMRETYRQQVARCFNHPQVDADFILDEINRCYDVFLNEIRLPDAIARNQALKENIFMMILCIELKIPLFIIGKPGSSKSLSKTLIAQKMQGSDRANSAILSSFKEAHLITFQCSPLSTSEMILKTFRHCAKFQMERKNDLDRYTSVVVLDEIGLAEASPSMPLKTLHPLLEKGVYFEEEEDEPRFRFEANRLARLAQTEAKDDWHKVGFLGISNWVLDPAKMNRGIFVNRCSPSIDELKETIQGICKNDTKVLRSLETNNLIESISKAYLRLCESARKTREFFGLRDFYSLIKMIYWYLKENEGAVLEWPVLEKLVKRNFGGLIGTDPRAPFVKQFQEDAVGMDLQVHDLNVIDLVKEALLKKTTEDENRYLLLLAQNENALDLLNKYILNDASEDDGAKESSKVRIIFGSSFPNDQNYSQICRKIHQIKLSMEMGSTVILLNLENLYESLYDALNQFYYKFGQNEKFVDLGLGTQRVKCLVHDNFRLIVVADWNTVYDTKKFPIPLVNRLEKHLLSMDSILTSEMKELACMLRNWCNLVTKVSGMQKSFQASNMRQFGRTGAASGALKPSDIFVGLTEDTVSSLVFKLCKTTALGGQDDADSEAQQEALVESIKKCLLQCATSDAIMRLIDANSSRQLLSRDEQNELSRVVDVYFKQQQHDNFKGFCRQFCLPGADDEQSTFIQITTNSKLLSTNEMKSMADEFGIKILHASLLAFDTQQQFRQELSRFFDGSSGAQTRLLVIQCECAHFYTELINCARYTIIDEFEKFELEQTEQKRPSDNNFRVLLIIQIPKIAGGCVSGFQTSKWFCYHIDELQDDLNFSNIISYQNKSLGELFGESLNVEKEERADESMQVDDEETRPSLLEGEQPTALREDNYLMLKKLLKTTVYIACSKINDQTFYYNDHVSSSEGGRKFVNRTVMRIEMLIDLLTGQDSMSEEFMAVLMRHLTRLQLSRESIMSTPSRSKSWIFNEVSNIANVIKYGTLKSSCRNYIENRLSHLFAGLVAYVDTNDNLDLLYLASGPSQSGQEQQQQSEQQRNLISWTRGLWLSMFKSEAFLNLDYRNHFVQASGTAEKAEFQCTKSASLKQSYMHDPTLRLKLPFSWIVKEFLDDLVHLNANTGPENADADSIFGERACRFTVGQKGTTESIRLLNQKLENAFEKSQLYSLLVDSIVEARERPYDFVRLYLNDYLLMASNEPFQSQAHLELIKKRVLHLCENQLKKSKTDLRILVSIHLIFENLQTEFKYLLKLIGLEPNILKALSDNPRLEISLALQAARYVCADFTRANVNMPKKEWEEWFNRIKRFASLIENFMETIRPSVDDPTLNAYYGEFKSTWQRIMSTRFMIEHISYLDESLFIRSVQMWPLLGTNVDFRTYETFQKFELFLQKLDERTQNIKNAGGFNCKGCNSSVSRKLYRMNVCDTCLVCEGCCETFKQFRQCPGCVRRLADDAPIQVEAVSNENALYVRFKISLNCLYMDVISNLCFGADNSSLPEKQVLEAVIKHLLPQSLNRDRALLNFNLNPSIKSTLFQLLLTYDQGSVESYLDEIFSNSSRFAKSNNLSNDLVELNLMYISAFEDNLYAKSTTSSTEENSILNIRNSLKYLDEIATEYLNPSHKHRQYDVGNEAEPNDNHMDKLRLIAKLRFVLTVYVHVANLYSTAQSDDYFSQEDEELNDSMRQFIENKEMSYLPRFFIIKLIFRLYGKQALVNLSRTVNFSWIIPKEIMQNSSKNLPDSYVVCGDTYLNIRTAIRDSFLTGQVDKLAASFQPIRTQLNANIYTFLVVYKEIVLFPDAIEDREGKCNSLLAELSRVFPDDQALLNSLLLGQVSPTHFVQNHQLSVSLLVMHIFVAFTKNPHLLSPFNMMLNNPGQFAQAFLPTMPHDEDFEAFQAFKNTTKDTFKFYKCPNGHLYSIGNCTKPAVTADCPTCKAKIGGVNHTSVEGNTVADDLVEKTQHGYCSLHHSQRPEQAESIRNMGMLNTSLLRLLLDCLLYMGVLRQRQASRANALIQSVPDEAGYFYGQIIKDVQILSRFIQQHSGDETLLFVHHLVDQMCRMDAVPPAHYHPNLATKEARVAFEKYFTDLIDPLINNNVERIFNQVTGMLEADAKKSDNDQLFRIAYDCIPAELSAKGLSASRPLSSATFNFEEKRYWAFRKQVTIEHMSSMLFSIPKTILDNNLLVLSRFVREMPQLQMLRHLPSICRMAKELHLLFDRQIERQYANSITVEIVCNRDDIVRNQTLRETIRNGARDFLKVWQACGHNIVSKCSFVSESFLDNPDLRTHDSKTLKLSYLLGNQYNEGRYIYAVLFYLITLQNEFVYVYQRYKLKMPRDAIEQLEKVDIQNLTQLDCISFVPEKEILQIVFMHSNYSLENQKNLNLEYDFDKIQNSVERKLVHGKPFIDENSILLIKFFDDVNGKKSQFDALNQKVPQAELSTMLKNDLCSFYKQPNQLNDIIKKLRIVIDFVASSGCPRQTKIMEYAEEVLKMPASPEDNNAKKILDDLEVGYLQSTWNLLNLKRVVLLSEHGQDPFDQLSATFKAELDMKEFLKKLRENEIQLPGSSSGGGEANDAKRRSKKAGDEAFLIDFITKGRRHFNKTQLFSMLALFYHYITYQLMNERSNQNESEEGLTGEHSLQDVLFEFNEETFDANNDQKVDFDKYDFRCIQVKHIYTIWKLLVQAYSVDSAKSF